MEKKQNNFRSFVNPNYGKTTEAQNLNWVMYETNPNYAIISSYGEKTGIKSTLYINKQKKIIKAGAYKTFKDANQVTTRQLFSLLMGIFKYKAKSYLLFVESVKLNKISNKLEIFETCTIVAISMDNFVIDKEMTDICNIIFKKGYFFSYQADLTHNFDQTNIIKFCDEKEPDWLFLVNRYMIKPFLNDKIKEWAIPVVSGSLMEFDLSLKDPTKQLHVTVLIRESMMDLINSDESQSVVQMISTSTSLKRVCLLMQIEDTSASISFLVNKLPCKKNFNMKRALSYFEFISMFLTPNQVILFFNGSVNGDYTDKFKNEKLRTKLGIKAMDTSKIDYPGIFKTFNERIRTRISFDFSNNDLVLLSALDSEIFFTSSMPYIIALCAFTVANTIHPNVNGNSTYNNMVLKAQEAEIHEKFNRVNKQYDIESLKNISKTSFVEKKGLFSSMISGFKRYSKSSIDNISEITPEECQNVLFSIICLNNRFLYTYFNMKKKQELELFKVKNLKISIVSHNCAGFYPNEDKHLPMIEYAKMGSVVQSDVIIICLQEIMAMKSENLKNIIFEESSEVKQVWRAFMEKLFKNTHILLQDENLLGLMTIVFVKSENMHFTKIDKFNSEFIKFGRFNLANKACIHTQIHINEETFDVLNCHLTSGTKENNFRKRSDNLKMTYKAIVSKNESLASFIVGDLNFRNSVDIDFIKTQIELYNKLDKTDKERQAIIDKMLNCDELSKVLQDQTFFHLKEEKIDFLPSYRFYIGSKEYDYAEGKRVPSWTDRVLYIIRDEVSLNNTKYFTDTETCVSDHKPVVFQGEFKMVDYPLLNN